MSFANKSIKRMIALVLTLMMLFGMIPMSAMQAGAATENNPDVFTITVTDGESNPVSGATVEISSVSPEFPIISDSVTDENGTVAFENVIAPGEGKSYQLVYTVKAEGFKDLTGAYEITDSTYTEDVKVTIEEEVVIKTADISVTVEGGNASVLINNKVQNTATVIEGESVPVVVTPARGYYISEITINGVKASTPAKSNPYSETIIADSNKDIKVTLIAQKTVTVKTTGSGTVSLNGDTSGTLTVDANDTVTVKAQAADNYNVASIVVGNTPYTIEAGKTYAELEFTADKDTEVSVVFVRIYTVTIKGSDEGSLQIINPETTAGSVTVREGSAVTVKATPNKNFRVVKFVRDDKEISASGVNDTAVSQVFENITSDTEITVVFAPNVYRVSVGTTVNGKVTVEGNPDVTHGNSSSVKITPSLGYTVKEIRVNDKKFDTVRVDDTGIYFDIARVTENSVVEVEFKKIAPATSEDYTINSEKNLVPNDDSTYVIADKTSIVYSTDKVAIALYDANGTLIGGGLTAKSVAVSKTVEVKKVRVYYQAEGELYPTWHDIETNDNIIVDVSPASVTLTPDRKPNLHGLYDNDVKVSVNVVESDNKNGKITGSGIDKIEYYIDFGSNDEPEYKTLYPGEENDEIIFSYTSANCITVDQKLCNKSGTIVKVKVTDRAGVVFEEQLILNINGTQPVTSVYFEGTVVAESNLNGNIHQCFKESPVVVYKVTDKSYSFNEEVATDGISIVRAGGVFEKDELVWEHSANGLEHTCRVQLEEQGNYKINEFEYRNLAGKYADNTNKLYCSYDLTPPEIKISFNDEEAVQSKQFFGYALEHFFYNKDKKLKVTVDVSDSFSGIDGFTYSYPGIEDVEVKGKNCTFEIPPEFKGQVKVNAIDRCNNRSEAIGDKIFVVDAIAPGVEVQYDNNAYINNKYYNAFRNAKLIISDNNLISISDVDVDVKIDVDGNSKAVERDFTPDGTGKYYMDIPFDNDGEYQLKVNYTDFSGNSTTYESDEFVIDTTAPVINVSYDNNSAENDSYFKEARTATITVTDTNFDEKDFKCDVLVNGVADPNYVSEHSKEWEHDGDKHTKTIEFVGDAYYEVSYSCKDKAGNANNGVNFNDTVAPEKFCIDTTGPSDLELSTETSVIGVLINTLTFGFVDKTLNVTISATDMLSGVDTFECYFADEDCVVDEEKTIKIDKSNISYNEETNTYTASFDVNPQYRGKIGFKVTDKAGVSASKFDEKIIVVDSDNPIVNVAFDNNDVQNEYFYKDKRTATISVYEENFFGTEEYNAADLVADINDPASPYLSAEVTRYHNGITYDMTNADLFEKAFEYDETSKCYTNSIDFAEDGYYTFTLNYSDRSGNKIEQFEDEFYIDKTASTIKVSYDPKHDVDENNIKYFGQDAITATVTVTEENFNASKITGEITAKNASNDVVELSEDYMALLKNKDSWTHQGNVHTAKLDFSTEGIYSIRIGYDELSGVEVKDFEDTICIDNSVPYEKDNTAITYSESIITTIMNNITFGFYNGSVDVTLTAYDDISGVNSFEYAVVKEGEIPQESDWITVDKSDKGFEVDKNKTTYKFKIAPEFRGYVVYKANDIVSKQTIFSHDEKVTTVIDQTKPGVSVSFTDTHSVDDVEYAESRTATITINEANFFPEYDIKSATTEELNEYLVIPVHRVNDDGTEEDYFATPVFTKDDKTGNYVGEIEFTENGDYTFDIEYTDRSNNSADPFEAVKFTIDNKPAQINVDYNDGGARNGKYFNSDRIANITIKEHNFNSDLVTVKVTRKSTLNGEVEDLNYNLVWNPGSEPDTNITSIKFDEKGFYTFDISYKDQTGKANNPVNYGTSEAPVDFVIDKESPDEDLMDIKIADKSIKDTDESVVFNNFYSSSIKVTLNANFDICGEESLEYFISSSYVTPSSIGDDMWTQYNKETGIVINPNRKFVLTVRATDKAGNQTIINSDGVVVDNQKPTGGEMFVEYNSPEIVITPEAPNENGFYSKDVTVGINVVDPSYEYESATQNGYYSGLKTISYQVIAEDTKLRKGSVLLNSASTVNTGKIEVDEDKLIKSWNGNIKISSKTFNSNKVVVVVTAEDNAGNSRTTRTQVGDIKIDITKPVIDVSYSNNAADSSKYFRANRVATVEITERNFNPEDVVLTLKNTDGTTPTMSDFKKVEGTALNDDGDKWVATINYDTDGDYVFDIDYTDLADNKAVVKYGNSVAPNEFTIDKIVPTIDVTYNNNNARNTNYYDNDRTATIVITEHNLEPNGVDANRINITLRATNDGANVAAPAVSSWRTNGNTHTATISYTSDARFEFDIAVTDKAGNASADYAGDTFYVDKTDPEIIISGVVDKSANKGDVIPVVTFSDTNFDVNNANITLSGAVRKSVALEGRYSNIHNGRTFTFYNFEKSKEVDDIYTLTATLTDMAGNPMSKTITFSVNRFGSTYVMGENTAKLSGSYVQSPIDVVVTETNANKLKNVKLTLFKNNETIVLTEGKDYKVNVTGGNGSWYQYVYTILKKNFADDGVYRLTFHSEDAAGNIAENTLDTKDAELSFGIDKTSPNVIATNLTSGVTYALENLTVKLSPSDNLLLDSLVVYLDNLSEPLRTWNAEEIANILATNGEFAFDIPGDSTSAHNVKLVCIDAAGNEQVVDINSFFVTTNLLVRYYNNKLLFFGSIAGVLLLAAAIVFIIVYKKRKNEQ